MVDASLSISAPRPQAAPPRSLPPAPPFADSLPAAPAPAAPLGAVPAVSGPGPTGTAASAATNAPAPPAAPGPAAAAGTPPGPAAAKPAAAHPSAFHVLLSEMNPLQYVPVVGTIYRAVTGDTIPEAARIAGGLVVSGLTGGPVGIAMNVGATLLERLTGIDPEKIGDRLLAELGIGHATPAHPATALAAATPPAAAAPAPAPSAIASSAPASSVPASSAPASSAPASSARAWSPAQLAAYGVTGGADGTLRRGTVSGADVLNSLELARIAAPAQGQPVPA
ncbi:MAG: hypothetical protein ACRYG6_13410 [Janthinobacterium lividum]